MLEPWVVWSFLLPCHSSLFIYVRMWGHRFCQPPPCGVCQLQPGLHRSTIRHLAGSASCCLATSPLHPSCPSPPLLPVWMNVSSLSPWLSDFHTVRFFWKFWQAFVFKFVVVLLLVVRGSTVCLPMPPSYSLLTLAQFLSRWGQAGIK